MKILVTGAGGLLGTHAAIRLHARNRAACYRGEEPPFDVIRLDRGGFSTRSTLEQALDGAAAVLHFAGVNRGPAEEVELANPAIAETLASACRSAGARPHIVYANSIHAGTDTAYGRSKARAGEILAEAGGSYAEVMLPHIFGEGARPYYNNVTATFIDQILRGETPTINPEGVVELVHAGAAAEAAIGAVLNGTAGSVELAGNRISVPELFEKLRGFHEAYQANVFPDLSERFDLELFNTYRAATYPDGWPRPLKVNRDMRGTLCEAVKGGGGGQCFYSTTAPGVRRGDHFHLSKVERFLVLEGEAIIRLRRAISDEVREFRVEGAAPSAVDMPTLHTHSIENVGDGPLITLFWTNDLFDPENPDTYADPVLR